MANGGDADACAELVASESVDGVWCDGEIVYDANGKRCVSRAVLDRVDAARSASPLPSAPVKAAAPASSSSSSGSVLLIAALVVVVLVVAVTRR
jgi:hypothetical protein